MNIHDTTLNSGTVSDAQDKATQSAQASDISQALDDYASMSDEDIGGDGCHPLFRNVPSSVGFNKLRKRLLRQTRQALDDFAMVRPGDRWLVALSGGKDLWLAGAAA